MAVNQNLVRCSNSEKIANVLNYTLQKFYVEHWYCLDDWQLSQMFKWFTVTGQW